MDIFEEDFLVFGLFEAGAGICAFCDIKNAIQS
jgi:hypothetical protein